MPELIQIYWRDIPSQVMAKAGRKAEKVMLSDRFQQAIDRAAMRAGKGGSDAYMEDWRRVRSPCSGDLKSEAEQAAAALESRFDDAALERIVKAKGMAPDDAPRSETDSPDDAAPDDKSSSLSALPD